MGSTPGILFTQQQEMGLQRNKVDKGREYLTMVLLPPIMSTLVRLYLKKKYHKN
jgi:hypothetical protein